MRIEHDAISPIRQGINKIARKIAPDPYDQNLQCHIMKEDRAARPVIISQLMHMDTNRFSRIEIETINECNGLCQFCPVNALVDPRIHITMSDTMFSKIIMDLVRMNYRGRIALFSNNEPLKDPNIVARIMYAKKMLPLAHHHLCTNGTLLNEATYLVLVDTLDELIINNYTPRIPRDLSRLVGKYNHNNVVIKMRARDELLSTRGGQAKNRLPIQPLASPCIHPFSQMVVRPNGRLSLCCNDALGVYTLGSLDIQTPLEAWNSIPYRNIRERLKRGRAGIVLCEGCDTLIKSLP